MHSLFLHHTGRHYGREGVLHQQPEQHHHAGVTSSSLHKQQRQTSQQQEALVLHLHIHFLSPSPP
jgi:hypothetical protein